MRWLSHTELENIKGLRPNQETDLWKALDRLYDRLDDRLVVIDSAKLGTAPIVCLTVFQAPDRERTSLYATVTRKGEVRIGKTKDLARTSAKLNLSAFEPLQAEVVSLVVTGRFRLVGEHLDLFVVVRSSVAESTNKTPVYHGILSIDQDMPCLKPARDDATALQTDWLPVAAHRLPAWLQECRVHYGRDADPFNEDLGRILENIIERQSGGIDAVAVGAHAAAYAADEQLVLRMDGQDQSHLPLTERVHAIALDEGKDKYLRAVVGYDDRSLLGIKWRENDSIPDFKWRQYLDILPTSIVLIAPEDDSVLPQILVGVHSGDCLLFESRPPDALDKLWEHCWARLGLFQADDRLSQAIRVLREDEKVPERYRLIALVGTLDAMVYETPSVTDDQRDDWVREIAAMFSEISDKTSKSVLTAGIDYLIRILKRSVEAAEKSEVSNEDKLKLLFASRLVYTVYQRSIPIAEREKIDVVVRVMDAQYDLSQNEPLKSLKEGARVTREGRWKKRPRPGEANLKGAKLIDWASLGLSRWPSAYVPAYSMGLRKLENTGIPKVAYLMRGNRPWLVCARGRSLELVEIKEHARLEPAVDCGNLAGLPPNEWIHQLMRIPGESDSIAVVTRSGTVGLLGLGKDHGAKPFLQSIKQIEPSGKGIVTAIARCDQKDQNHTLLAVVRRLGSASKLSLYRLSTGTIMPFGPEHDIPLTGISCMEFENNPKGGYWLLIGIDHPGPIYRYAVGNDGVLGKFDKLILVEEGILSLQSDSTEKPRFLLAGGESGLVRCLDLETSGDNFLCWTYQLSGAIRCAARERYDGAEDPSRPDRHFLVGTERGELCLLRASDGCRIWEDRVQKPVRRLITLRSAEPPLAAVVLSDGNLLTFVHLRYEERRKAFQESQEYLYSLSSRDDPSISNDLWNPPDAQSARAFHSLLVLKERLETVIARHKDNREASARIVRYVAKGHVELTKEQRQEFISHLTVRNLTLLLNYLDERPQKGVHFRDWLDLIDHQLRQQEANCPQLIKGWAGFIRQFGLHAQSVDELLQHRPPDSCFEEAWIRIEFQRVFARLCHRKDPAGSILPELLIHCLELPPVFFTHLESIFVPDSLADKNCRALRDSMSDQSLPGRAEALIVDTLKSNPMRDPWLEVLYRLLFLQVCFAEKHSTPWPKWRTAGLTCFRELYTNVRAYKSKGRPRDRVVEGVREMLGSSPPPEDTDRSPARRSWWEETQSWLKTFDSADARLPGGGWNPYTQKLWQQTRDILIDFCEWEIRFLRQLVRPYLSLHKPLRAALDGRVTVTLRVEPEGLLTLKDVKIRLDARKNDSNPEGLQAPGFNDWELTFAEYPADYADRDLEIGGYASPVQRTVCVRVTLSALDEATREELWRFPIHKVNDHEGTNHWHLNEVYTEIRKEIAQTRSRIFSVPFDVELGRTQFLGEWDSLYPQSRLDLDATVHAQRSRHDKSLQINQVTAEIDQRLRDPIFKRQRHRVDAVLLLAPADELFKYLRDHERPEYLNNWLNYLTPYAGSNNVRLAALISSENAAFLRACTEIPELGAHLVLQRQFRQLGYQTQNLGIVNELKAVAKSQLSDHRLEILDQAIDKLGADLRLILKWISSVKGQDHGANIQNCLKDPEVNRIIHYELASLFAIDYLLVVAGINSMILIDRRQAEPGHVAAEDYYSTTRHSQSKRLQDSGKPFTEDSLNRINSDARPPVKLRIQGVGTGTPDAYPPGVMQLIMGLSRNDREKRMERLANLGFGSWIGGILRTGHPYREYLQDLHERHRTGDHGTRLNRVYQQLAGPDRWLAEALEPKNIVGWKAEELKLLMPQARNEDLTLFIRLAALWHKGGSEAQIKSALEALFSSTLRRNDLEQAVPPEAERAGVIVYRLDNPSVIVTNNLVWLSNDSHLTIEDLSTVIMTENPDKTIYPLIAIGPGVENFRSATRKRVALLRFRDLRESTCRGDLLRECRRKVHSQLGLRARSPFQSTGALPPGSPVFVGREHEKLFIEDHIDQKSILIVGARRIGKTSLLNYIFYWVREKRPDLWPIRVELQGAQTEEEFCERLRAYTRADYPDLITFHDSQSGRESAFGLLGNIVQKICGERRVPVFLFNEIDGIAEHNSRLMSDWRERNDRGDARFVFTGYTVVASLGDVEAPLFHFTLGDRFGGKALAPTVLSSDAAREILDLIQQEPLDLRWRSNDEKQRCYQELLEHSYRIPWVLQCYGELLVSRLEEQRRDTVTYDDVLSVINQGGGGVLMMPLSNNVMLYVQGF